MLRDSFSLRTSHNSSSSRIVNRKQAVLILMTCTIRSRKKIFTVVLFLLLNCLCISSGILSPQQHDAILPQNKFHKNKACSPYFKNDETSLTLWRNAFINARYELSLVDYEIEWNNIFSSGMKKRINNFFIANVSSCIYMIDGTPVWYVTIFKAGNNNIRGNLQVL